MILKLLQEDKLSQNVAKEVDSSESVYSQIWTKNKHFTGKKAKWKPSLAHRENNKVTVGKRKQSWLWETRSKYIIS